MFVDGTSVGIVGGEVNTSSSSFRLIPTLDGTFKNVKNTFTYPPNIASTHRHG